MGLAKCQLVAIFSVAIEGNIFTFPVTLLEDGTGSGASMGERERGVSMSLHSFSYVLQQFQVSTFS